jgi:AbiV family abortive infection protein
MNDKELEKGFQLVIENATSLIKEAKLLLENNYLARAYTLAQLSIEEVGKANMLHKAILSYYLGEKVSSKYLDKLGFRDHKEKTKNSLNSELIAIWMYEKSVGKKTGLRDSLLDDYNKIEDLNNLKNKSLYVSVDEDAFISPNNCITKDMVLSLLQKAEIRLAAEEPLLRPLEEMKKSAILLGAISKDPIRLAQLKKRASEYFGDELF